MLKFSPKFYSILLTAVFCLSGFILQSKEEKKDPKAKEMLRLQKYYLSHNLDSSFYFGRKLYAYATVKNLNTDKSNALYYLSTAFSRKDEMDSALFYANECLKMDLKEGDSTHICSSYNQIGALYKDMQNYKKALDYYIKSYTISERNKDEKLLISTNINLGGIFVEIKNYPKAISYFKEAERLCMKTKYYDNLGGIYNNLAIASENSGKLNEANGYYAKSFRFFESINDIDGMANVLNSRAGIYYYENKLDSSLYFIEKSVNMYLSINDSLNAATKAINYASLLIAMERYNDAKEVLDDFKKIAVRFSDKSQYIGYFDTYAQVLHKLGRSDEAYRLLFRMRVVNDSLNNTVNAKRLNEIEAKFNVTKERMEKMRLKKDKEIADQKNAKLSVYIISAIVLMGLLLMLVLLFFRSSKQKQKTNDQLLKLNEEITASRKSIEHQNLMLEEKQKEITDSINYAQRIQNAYLPPQSAFLRIFENSFLLFKPKDIVSGDFYWCYHPKSFDRTDKNIAYFAVADCTGHGVPGALMSVICCNALNEAIISLNLDSTGEILDKTRELVIRNLKSKIDSGQKDGMDIILGCLNFDTLELMYSGANNSLLVFRNDENKLETIPADKQPVGVYDRMKPFSTHVLQLNKGDVIFAYSDGYADQFGGEKGKKFKYSNLNNLLLSNVHLPMEELSNKLNEVFEEWRGSLEQVDDVCVMGIKI